MNARTTKALNEKTREVERYYAELRNMGRSRTRWARNRRRVVQGLIADLGLQMQAMVGIN